MFISAMLIFGTIGVFRRQIALSSGFLAFARGIIGGLFMLAVGRMRNGPAERIPFRKTGPMALTGAMIGINWILLFEAYNYTTVSIATLCYYMQPTIVMLLAPVFFQERLTGKKALCALIAILGMVLVSGVPGESGSQGTNLKGIALGLGAAAFYAAVIILNKKIRETDPYQRTTVQLLSAGLVMVPYLLATGQFGGLNLDGSGLLLLLLVGVVHTGVAYLLYFRGMSGLKVQSIAVLSYIDPVSALLFSAVLLGEALDLIQLIGAAMIIGSAMISETQQTGSSA